jgi:hypothetical protein
VHRFKNGNHVFTGPRDLAHSFSKASGVIEELARHGEYISFLDSGAIPTDR